MVCLSASCAAADGVATVAWNWERAHSSGFAMRRQKMPGGMQNDGQRHIYSS